MNNEFSDIVTLRFVDNFKSNFIEKMSWYVYLFKN